MDDQPDRFTVSVTYRGTTETRFEKGSTWSDRHRFARE